MRDPSFYVSGLLDLHKLGDLAERRATWRQSMAALARAAAEDGPAPLDGLHPEALLSGVKVALQMGLVDDLDWLAPPAAGAALYELASALPLGPEQRELGRRVLSRLIEGDAESFVAIATRMARGAGKGLSSPAARARVALVAELPIGVGVADGALALALTSRRELAREWISLPSTGSLPARRLAARLLERAAREASRRASQGDDHTLRVFKSDAVSQAWDRLLADRESLVWRHVATARGLLAPWVPAYAREIEAGLSPKLSPTEWRRAATSLAAQAAVAPEAAMKAMATATAQGGLLERDPGAAAAFVWGLPRAVEAEPDAAEEILETLLQRAPSEVAEAIVEIRFELGQGPFAERASRRALAELAKQDPKSGDDGAEALRMEVARDLEQAPRDDQPLRDQLSRALLAFAHAGARPAYAAAREVLDAAKGAMDALDAVAPDDDTAEGRAGSLARRTSLAVLRDLDISLLERALLSDLLRLGPAGETRPNDEALEQIRQRFATWVLAREGKPLPGARQSWAPGVAAPPLVRPAHATLALRRLRALLHLVDGDVGEAGEDSARAGHARKRLQTVTRALLERFEKEPPSTLRRATLATLVRAIDALVRAGACDVSDALLVLARHVVDPNEFTTLAEASMDPDLIHVLTRWAAFCQAQISQLKVVEPPSSGASLPPPSNVPEHVRKLAAAGELAKELVPDASGRMEALRTVLVRIHAALHAIAQAPSLRALQPSSDGEAESIVSLESALGALAQLTLGARGRFDPERAPQSLASAAAARPLTVAVSRVLSGAEPTLQEQAIASCLDELVALVPRAIGRLVSSVVWTLVELPVERPSIDSQPVRMAEQALPNWLPARRTLGGFYVVRPLSAGAVGSVFIVTRVEDRHDPHAERFALKVPEYSATAARSVSEADFLKMFREEASALMAVPQHSNLARFVTFDAGSRPKPILVMELVEGMSLDKVIESGAMDSARAYAALDDVLAGLEAMHSVGVGHLDLKPSNVLLRKGEEAVLVDFGLAGRHIRPGCATGPYGAPEVWGALPPATPMAADIYAFGCLAYEVFTGKTLFAADNETQQVAQHVAHDGMPPKLRALAAKNGSSPLVELLFSALRRDPKDRADVKRLRADLRRMAPYLLKHKWPVA